MNKTYTFFVYFIYFVLFSSIGWTIENVWNFFYSNFVSCNPVARLLSNKVCLIPLIPTYGFAGLTILLVTRYVNYLPYRLFLYMILFNIGEMIIGLIGKYFICNKISTCQNGDKMWDYRDNPNISGYIDIKHTFYWVILGYLGELAIKNIQPDNPKIYIVLIIIYIIVSITKYGKNVLPPSDTHLLQDKSNENYYGAVSGSANLMAHKNE